MKFDKEVEKILESCLLKEGVMDFIGGALKQVAKGYKDRLAQAFPKTSEIISAGLDEVEGAKDKKKQRLTGVAGVAEMFLNEKFEKNNKNNIIINGTPYNYKTLLKKTPKLYKPKMNDEYIINGKKIKIIDQNTLGKALSQFNIDSKNRKDLKRAQSLLRNKDLNTLNLLSDPNIKNEISNFLEEQSQIYKTKNIGEAKVNKGVDNKKEINNIDYSKITPEEIIKNLRRIIGFYLKTTNPQYFSTKLKYLFAFSKDRQIIR